MARSSTSLVAFLVGAALGGRLAVAMAATSRRRWLLTVALSEALLLVAAAIASIGFDIGSATPPQPPLHRDRPDGPGDGVAQRDRAATRRPRPDDHGADPNADGRGRRLFCRWRRQSSDRTSRRFGRLDVRRGGGRDPAFTARAGSPADRGCGRRARRHGRLRRRPDATTGAGLGTTRRSGRTPTKVG